MTRNRRISLAAAVVAIAALAVFAVAGSYGHSSSSPAAAAAAKKKPALALRKTSLGRVLGNTKGRTLFQIGADTKKNVSNCAGARAQKWPPAKAAGKPNVAKGLSQRKLKVI